MDHSSHHTLTRLGAAGVLAVGVLLGGALGAVADPLPAPVGTVATMLGQTVPSSTLPAPAGLPNSQGVGTVLDVVTGTQAPGDSASGAAPRQQHSTDAQTVPAEGTPPHSGKPAGDASAAEARVSSEPLSACVIPTGSASPALEFDLSVLGNDAGGPLAHGIPQGFTPCPAGARPAGDPVLAADADVEHLIGACVRVTREVAPLQTTLVVLDRDVIEALTSAGLRLEQLVVPCPAGSATGTTGTGSGLSTGNRETAPQAASAVPGLPHRLAFTGSDLRSTLAVALGLLALGSVLTRQAARARARA